MAKKSLGQNFLMHPQTAARIVAAAQVPEHVPVLEIGPGTGMLTRALLGAGHTVIAVEADAELLPILGASFADEMRSNKLTLVHADIRDFATTRLPEHYALVANIPYYITGEIIRSFLTAGNKPESMTLLVQKEVAERIVRAKKESLLSLSVKAFGTPKYCFKVPKGAFKPAPAVDSAVISIQNIHKEAFRSSEEEECFFELLRTGFAHKRKLLLGNLSLLYPSERVKEALTSAEVSLKARAEDLSLADWRHIFEFLTG